jgi:hypothetical protein
MKVITVWEWWAVESRVRSSKNSISNGQNDYPNLNWKRFISSSISSIFTKDSRLQLCHEFLRTKLRESHFNNGNALKPIFMSKYRAISGCRLIFPIWTGTSLLELIVNSIYSFSFIMHATTQRCNLCLPLSRKIK